MFPDRSREIQFHKEAARRCVAEGNHTGARSAYFKWVESVRQQNINTNGQLQHDLEEARKEYSEFVRTDPIYLRIREAVTEKIKDHPDILQTDLYSVLDGFNKEDIDYAMYFAAEHGAVIRTKKGRTYSLSLP